MFIYWGNTLHLGTRVRKRRRSACAAHAYLTSGFRNEGHLSSCSLINNMLLINVIYKNKLPEIGWRHYWTWHLAYHLILRLKIYKKLFSSFSHVAECSAEFPWLFLPLLLLLFFFFGCCFLEIGSIAFPSLSIIWECEEFPMTTSFKSPWQRYLRSASDCLTQSKTQLCRSLSMKYQLLLFQWFQWRTILVFISQNVCISIPTVLILESYLGEYVFLYHVFPSFYSSYDVFKACSQ